jgi:hypothetical protein
VVVLLFMLCGFAGSAASLVLVLGYQSAAALFGFAPLTPDQVGGVAGLGFTVGCLGSAAVFGAIMLWDEIRR